MMRLDPGLAFVDLVGKITILSTLKGPSSDNLLLMFKKMYKMEPLTKPEKWYFVSNILGLIKFNRLLFSIIIANDGRKHCFF